MIDAVRRYADLHRTSISEVIRQGLDMRLNAAQQVNGFDSNTLLPAATMTMLTRLSTVLDTAADQLRSAFADAMGAPAEAPQSPPEAQEYNGNIEYNGNTIQDAPTTELQPAPQHQRGRQPSPLRQQILTLLTEHPEGLSPEQIRVYLNPEKPIGDVLQSMRRAGVVHLRGDGYQKRYFVA